MTGNRRMCTLMQIVSKNGRGWISGPTFCATKGILKKLYIIISCVIYSTSECHQDKKVNKLKILKTRKQKSILDCRRRCQENPYCDYFKFKDHPKLSKRKCFLMRIFIPKNDWVSGEKFCSVSDNVTSSTMTPPSPNTSEAGG